MKFEAVIILILAVLATLTIVRSMIEKDQYKAQLFRIEGFVMFCYVLLLIK